MVSLVTATERVINTRSGWTTICEAKFQSDSGENFTEIVMTMQRNLTDDSLGQ
jgi:hypothetical protein